MGLFSFGSAAPAAPATTTGGFSFGGSSSTTTPTPGGFTFGAASAVAAPAPVVLVGASSLSSAILNASGLVTPISGRSSRASSDVKVSTGLTFGGVVPAVGSFSEATLFASSSPSTSRTLFVDSVASMPIDTLLAGSAVTLVDDDSSDESTVVDDVNPLVKDALVVDSAIMSPPASPSRGQPIAPSTPTTKQTVNDLKQNKLVYKSFDEHVNDLEFWDIPENDIPSNVRRNPEQRKAFLHKKYKQIITGEFDEGARMWKVIFTHKENSIPLWDEMTGQTLLRKFLDQLVALGEKGYGGQIGAWSEDEIASFAECSLNDWNDSLREEVNDETNEITKKFHKADFVQWYLLKLHAHNLSRKKTPIVVLDPVPVPVVEPVVEPVVKVSANEPSETVIAPVSDLPEIPDAPHDSTTPTASSTGKGSRKSQIPRLSIGKSKSSETIKPEAKEEPVVLAETTVTSVASIDESFVSTAAASSPDHVETKKKNKRNKKKSSVKGEDSLIQEQQLEEKTMLEQSDSVDVVETMKSIPTVGSTPPRSTKGKNQGKATPTPSPLSTPTRAASTGTISTNVSFGTTADTTVMINPTVATTASAAVATVAPAIVKDKAKDKKESKSTKDTKPSATTSTTGSAHDHSHAHSHSHSTTTTAAAPKSAAPSKTTSKATSPTPATAASTSVPPASSSTTHNHSSHNHSHEHSHSKNTTSTQPDANKGKKKSTTKK